MFSRLAVRNIAPEVWSGLEDLAQRHERSVEAEARYALRAWVEPWLNRKERSARRTELAGRLGVLLEAVNATLNYQRLRPSHIAQAIGEEQAEPTEGWFTGQSEPSFAQLAAIAKHLGARSAWLQHGDGDMFEVEIARFNERRCAEVASWLIDADQAERPSCVHLMRPLEETGNLVVVKEYGARDHGVRHTKTYTTGINVSQFNGATGEIHLANFALALELIDKSPAKQGSIGLQSYLISKEQYAAVVHGKLHPLTILRGNSANSLWWQDLWDETIYAEQTYWPDWKQTCDNIKVVIDNTKRLKDERTLIRSGKHPFSQP